MQFAKRMLLKHKAKNIAYIAVKTHRDSNSKSPTLFEDIRAITKVTQELEHLGSHRKLDDSEWEVVLKGLAEGLINEGVQSEDSDAVTAFCRHYLKGESNADNERNVPTESENSKREYVISKTIEFMRISTLMVDYELLNREFPKVGSLLFLAGVASYLARKCSLEDDEALGRAVVEIAVDYGLSRENATRFVTSINELLAEPFGKSAFNEGIHAIRLLDEGHDSGGLRLKRLVDEWAEIT